MKRIGLTAVVLCGLLGVSGPVRSHCEIPCGIYDDELRAKLIDEHIGTVEKSMKQIAELSRAAQPNHNQLVRWIGNKEKHAGEIQHIVTQYFMTQRVKPADPADAAAHHKYVAQVTLLHRMLIHAMKAKQTTDLAHVEALRKLSAQFRAAYFGKHAADHAHEH